jgi:hypothetical protein
MGRAKRHFLAGILVALVAGMLATGSPRRVEGAVEPRPPCDAWQVEYALAANLTLADTPHGQGNGTFSIGPGRVVLLFSGPGQQQAQLLGYSMQEHFSLTPSTVFGSAEIDVDLTTRTAEGCGVAYGVRSGNTIQWSSRVRGYRSDGTTTCAGALCGKFGAPREGQNPWLLRPQDVQFGTFTFSADGSTFTMPTTFVEASKNPQQTAYVALSGREVRRTCVKPDTCR